MMLDGRSLAEMQMNKRFIDAVLDGNSTAARWELCHCKIQVECWPFFRNCFVTERAFIGSFGEDSFEPRDYV